MPPFGKDHVHAHCCVCVAGLKGNRTLQKQHLFLSCLWLVSFIHDTKAVPAILYITYSFSRITDKKLRGVIWVFYQRFETEFPKPHKQVSKSQRD
jgi:hypothetical protein